MGVDVIMLLIGSMAVWPLIVMVAGDISTLDIRLSPRYHNGTTDRKSDAVGPLIGWTHACGVMK